MAAFVLGKDCKLFRNTGSFGSPTWVEITVVKNVTLKIDKGEWDGSSRGSSSWAQLAATMKKAAVDFDMVFTPADAGYGAVRDAFINNSMIDVAVATGPIATTATEYLHAESDVFTFERSEPLEEGVMVKCTAKPRPSTNAPVYTVVS